MYTLQNSILKIAVKKIGAELCEISSVNNKTQFMWNANPDIWGSFAPNLFPVIGSLKNDQVLIDGNFYNVPKHGFVRRNTKVLLKSKTASCLEFSLKYDNELLQIYPYKFEFIIKFELKDNAIKVTHTVVNLDNQTIYFSVGGHPAFKCPVFENEAYSDYYLEFDKTETAKSYVLNMNLGLLTDESFPIISENNTIALHYDLFKNDALIFKNLQSKSVALKSKTQGEILSVHYPDFQYLGIWAKPHADYVCIEPWLGIADHENHNQDFKTKEGIQPLNPNKTFEAVYTIEIDKKHLV